MPQYLFSYLWKAQDEITHNDIKNAFMATHWRDAVNLQHLKILNLPHTTLIGKFDTIDDAWEDISSKILSLIKSKDISMTRDINVVNWQFNNFLEDCIIVEMTGSLMIKDGSQMAKASL
ncbi:MAG: hypothetical protein ABF443_14095 [Acetobacter malorum]|uniref:hypothetical protein n=1 Tax=Acetobacter malorum TaxID=178901 RepID=UPI0039EB2B20